MKGGNKKRSICSIYVSIFISTLTQRSGKITIFRGSLKEEPYLGEVEVLALGDRLIERHLDARCEAYVVMEVVRKRRAGVGAVLVHVEYAEALQPQGWPELVSEACANDPALIRQKLREARASACREPLVRPAADAVLYELAEGPAD